jgi:hypothetical protein
MVSIRSVNGAREDIGGKVRRKETVKKAKM